MALTQAHFRFRTDGNAVDATPTWGADEDASPNPATTPFRLRLGLTSTAAASGEFEIYAQKNAGSYAAITTSSTGGVQSFDASSSADDTAILVPRLTMGAVPWQLAGAAIALDFTGNRVYPSGTFTDYLSCSRASVGYATNADGTLTQFSADTLRRTNLGLLRETAATNLVLWNRDLTNAVWTATNITPLKNQTGPDGVTNSASSITATAGNGTILQSITVGNSWRGQSAYVKRITGTGTVNMTQDNGATWTAITVTSNWTLVRIPAAVLSNPTVGFQIVTSGDAIAVDFVQNEQGLSGEICSSPIETTTVSATRAADNITVAGTLDTLLQGTDGSVVLDFKNLGFNGADNFQLLAATSNIKMFWLPGTLDDQIASKATYDVGANFASGILGSTGAKAAIGFSAAGRSLVGGNGTVATDSDQPYGYAGYKLGSADGLGGGYALYRCLTFWNSRLADAVLKGHTVP